MSDEMEYMNICQYCLNLIKNNLKLFLESKYASLMEKEYKSSDEAFYDVMFYFSIVKKYLNEIGELPKVIINTIYNLKIFRNKIAHQVPITLREFYRFVDDTQTILELLNTCDKNEVIKIQNTRKEIINRMTILDDNNIIIGSSYNAGNKENSFKINLNTNKIGSNSDIEMEDYDEIEFFQDKKENSRSNNQNSINNGVNYNDFNKKENENNMVDNKEKERIKKINDNFNIIMENKDKNNFMQVKKVNFSNI